MVAWIIGIFFIVAGLMMWPAGVWCFGLGVIICLIKFFSQYKSVDNYAWAKTFEKSSFVDELVDEINGRNPKSIEIRSKFISIDDRTIKFESRDIGALTMLNCQTLADTIKSKMRDGSKYEVKPKTRTIGSSGGGHDRPIGMTQTANGNFVFDYGDRGSCTELIGYDISLKEKPQKPVKNTTKRSEWK